MPREAIASKIETAEQIAATYSRIHSTFCQNIAAGAKENMWGKTTLKNKAITLKNKVHYKMYIELTPREAVASKK